MKDWIPVWGYRETEFLLFPVTVENETQRLWFYNNLASDTLRLRFSNRYGKEMLPLEQVTVAICDEKGRIFPEKNVSVTFDSEKTLNLAPGQTRYCDPVNLRVEPGMWIAVSIYIKERTYITSAVSSQSCLITRMSGQKGGNFCDALEISKEHFISGAYNFLKHKPLYHMVAVALTQVEIWCENKQAITAITVFGDSITQHGHWSEALTQRLYAAAPGRVTVVNRGICGNRILHNASIRSGFGDYFGESALERFEDDVYKTSGNKTDLVIMEEGVNDIIQPFDNTCTQYERVTAEQILEGYRKIAHIAHKHRTKIYGSTIMPFKGFHTVWNKDSEAIRHTVNEILNCGNIFDKVLDFASVVCSARDTACLQPEYNCGDNLHPNALGGRAIAEFIKLDDIMDQ